MLIDCRWWHIYLWFIVNFEFPIIAHKDSERAYLNQRLLGQFQPKTVLLTSHYSDSTDCPCQFAVEKIAAPVGSREGVQI